MRRTFERNTKARLSFSGGPHAPVNMAESMENAGNSTVSGSKEAMKDSKNSRICENLRQNKAQYSAANAPFSVFFSTDIHFFHIIRQVYRSVWPAREAKPRFGASLWCRTCTSGPEKCHWRHSRRHDVAWCQRVWEIGVFKAHFFHLALWELCSSSAIWSCLTNKLRVFFRFSWGAFFLASRKGLWSNWPLFRVRFRTLLGNWPNV